MIGIVTRLWARQEESWFSSRFLFLFFLKHLHHPNQFTKSGQEIFFSMISPLTPQTYIRTHRLEVPSSASFLPNLVLRYFDVFELLEFMRNQKLE